MAGDDERRWRRNNSTPTPGHIDAGYATGYETDSVAPGSGKRSTKAKLKKKRSKAAVGGNDTGYETDDGYISSSAPALNKKQSKSRMFRLGNRSKSNVQAEEPPPPPPLPEPVPVFRLPIAARFATTLGDLNANATAEPPLPPPVRPFAAETPSTSGASSPTTFFDSSSMFDSALRDAERDSPEPAESTTTHSMDHGSASVTSHSSASSPPRNHPRFASSDSSEIHGSSSTNHSFFSKWSASSSSSYAPHPKHPPISYPLTRSPSPPSPTYAQQTSFSDMKKPSESLTIDSSLSVPASTKNGSAEWSPFVVVTPTIPTTPERSVSPAPPAKRPLFLARTVKPPSPKASQTTYLGDDIQPSADYVLPSPRSRFPSRSQSPAPPRSHSPLPPSPRPPNRSHSPALQPPPSHLFASRELPPPSPPPTTSLPQVPDDQGFFAQAQDQRPRRQFVVNAPIVPKRGKESPFPARPVLTPNGTMPTPGLEARMKVRRYRDLYTLPQPYEQPAEDVVSRFKRESESSGEGSDDLRAALDADQAYDALDVPRGGEGGGYESDGRSYYPEDDKSMGRETMYRYERGAESTGNLSTWSADEGARMSIMDVEKSVLARERFIQRIESMFDSNGRELPQARVPPVPKLPAAYAKPVPF